MSTIMKASNQWSSRPADERFSSLADLHNSMLMYRSQAAEAPAVPYSSLRVEAHDGDIKLLGKSNVPSSLTHWAFGQLSQRVGAPPAYLRELPATLAAQNLNHGLAHRVNGSEDGEDTANLLLHKNGGYMVRAFTSDKYRRIWNADITSRLVDLEAQGTWQPAPAAFDGSRGLYGSDHDMFAFLVDNKRRIFEKDPNGGLSRGFFTWNSEVGAKSFGVMSFLYQYVCGNHIVWGAEKVSELRVRHIGEASARAFGELEAQLVKYADSSSVTDELKIESARTKILGASKDEVLDAVFGLRIAGLSQRLIGQAYDLAVEHEDWYGNPRSVWGMSSGLTQVARDLQYADKRVDLEQAAGRLMQVAF